MTDQQPQEQQPIEIVLHEYAIENTNLKMVNIALRQEISKLKAANAALTKELTGEKDDQTK